MFSKTSYLNLEKEYTKLLRDINIYSDQNFKSFYFYFKI